MDELSKYADRDLTASSLDIVHKLASAEKNLCKICEMCEDEGQSNYSGRSYSMSGNSSYGVEPGRDGMSYARGRRNAPRDSMGRYSGEGGYSRHGNVADRLREMMEDVPDEQTRRELERITRRMEQG